ncbi:hypothetical protein Tco_1029424 [Tanacetum coccineum]|uniref:Uncharacterized protein n=1 Tax=Tanacetum coccineum TaxID=301880 RepID=A0ABQ5G3E4_9ASTR
MDRSIGIDIPVCIGRPLVKLNHSALLYRIYGVCIGILAFRGLSLVSSPLHARKSQSPFSVFRCSEIWGVTFWKLMCSPNSYDIHKMYIGLPQLTRLSLYGSSSLSESWREHSQEINNLSVPALISQAPGPSRKRSRSPSSPFFPDAITFSDGKPASETSKLNPEDVTARLEDLEVEVDTLHADTEDKELLISELQDSLAAAESEIAILQIRVADTESRRAEDHEQIQKILARLGM